jgi:hypothetical protein
MKSLGQLLRPLFANASFAGFHLANMVLRDSQPILSPSNTTKATDWPPLLQLVILAACPETSVNSGVSRFFPQYFYNLRRITVSLES